MIGLGRIGAHLADLALAFGMRVLAATPQPIDDRAGRIRRLPLVELLAASDFVVCLAPAQADTANLMDAAAFAAMRRGAFFVNAVARRARRRRRPARRARRRATSAAAALDVGRAPDQMPAPSSLDHPRVIATPHIGGLTQPAIEHQALETVAQLAQLLKGEMPVGAVNPDHADRWRRWRGRQRNEGAA